jgi:hypothetical protein
MFERLETYDSDHCSVWRNRNTGDILLTVRGTQLTNADITSDLQILLGKTRMEDLEVKSVLEKLSTDYPNEKYSVAAHSLGCAFVMEEAARYHDDWDNTFMFNAPSSPAQDDGVLKNRVNEYGLDFYQNHGDLLGANTNYMFNNQTLDEHVYWGGWRWDPVSSHSLTQWYPDNFHKAPATSTAIDNQESTLDTAEFQQDTPETQEAGLS